MFMVQIQSMRQVGNGKVPVWSLLVNVPAHICGKLRKVFDSQPFELRVSLTIERLRNFERQPSKPKSNVPQVSQLAHFISTVESFLFHFVANITAKLGAEECPASFAPTPMPLVATSMSR